MTHSADINMQMTLCHDPSNQTHCLLSPEEATSIPPEQVLLLLFLVYWLACECLPATMTRLMSNPFVATVRWSFLGGQRTFNFQTLNFVVYHPSRFNQVLHWITVPSDAILWLAILSLKWSSPATFPLATSLLTLQAWRSSQSLRWGLVAAVAWGYLSMAAWWIASQVSSTTPLVYALLGDCLVRVLGGHGADLAPSYMWGYQPKPFEYADKVFQAQLQDGDNPLASVLQIVVNVTATTVIGGIGDLMSGLPCYLLQPLLFVQVSRALPSLAHWATQPGMLSYAELEVEAHKIWDLGMMASPVTAPAFAKVLPPLSKKKKTE